jgi:hypothetical protein
VRLKSPSLPLRWPCLFCALWVPDTGGAGVGGNGSYPDDQSIELLRVKDATGAGPSGRETIFIPSDDWHRHRTQIQTMMTQWKVAIAPPPRTASPKKPSNPSKPPKPSAPPPPRASEGRGLTQLRVGALRTFLSEHCQGGLVSHPQIACGGLSPKQARGLTSIVGHRLLAPEENLLSAAAFEQLVLTKRHRLSHGEEAAGLNRLREICGLPRMRGGASRRLETESPLSSGQQHAEGGQSAEEEEPEGKRFWVQCDEPSCGKWRCLGRVIEAGMHHRRWTCAMHPDPARRGCHHPEESYAGDPPPTHTPHRGCSVGRAFSSWNRSILTEIYLCHACSYHEILRTTAPPRSHPSSAGTLTRVGPPPQTWLSAVTKVREQPPPGPGPPTPRQQPPRPRRGTGRQGSHPARSPPLPSSPQGWSRTPRRTPRRRSRHCRPQRRPRRRRWRRPRQRTSRAAPCVITAQMIGVLAWLLPSPRAAKRMSAGCTQARMLRCLGSMRRRR